jgi:hypothetical protein
VITRTDLEKLARVHAVPAVTIVLSTERAHPGNMEDPRRLRQLVDTARARLHHEYGARNVAALVDRLESIGSRVDWDHPTGGFAAFATSDELHVYPLAVDVEDRLVIGETFVTRDLLRAMQRSDRYRALVLSARVARLFEGNGDVCTEVIEGGFPMQSPPRPAANAPHRDLPVHERKSEEDHRFVFRSVDRALNERGSADPLPLVVVAVERDLAYFDDVTAHGRLIVGRVKGDHTHDGAAAIARLTAPVAAAHFRQRRHDATATVDRAAGAQLAVGVHDCWLPATTGRGRLLVVEDGYRYRARLVDGALVATDDEPAPGVIDDAVGEMIDAVLLHGGDAVIVDTGALGDHGPVALVLRF